MIVMYNRLMSFLALFFYAAFFYHVIIGFFDITQSITKIIIAIGTIAVVDWTIDKINSNHNPPT